MTDAERKVRRAALLAAEEWTGLSSEQRLSDHIVDVVLDTMSTLTDDELSDLLGRAGEGGS